MNELPNKIKSGLIGALMLANVYVLITIAICYMPTLLPTFGSALRQLVQMDRWSLNGIRYIFFAIAVLGFLLGYSFHQAIKKWFPPAMLGISLAILLVGIFLYFYASGVHSQPK